MHSFEVQSNEIVVEKVYVLGWNKSPTITKLLTYISKREISKLFT